MEQVRKQGFSLVELLVVLAIVGVVATMALPALRSLLSGSSLDRGGQTLGDVLVAARQEAVSKNRDVEVRFFRLPSSTGRLSVWCGVQSFRIEQSADGSTFTPIGPIVYLPPGIVISESDALSPLLGADVSLRGSTNLPTHRDVPYAGFRYRANGSTGSELTTANNFLTLQNETDTGPTPSNYYTIQVNPITGKVSVFRP